MDSPRWDPEELHRVEAFKCKQKCDHPAFESFTSTIVTLGVFQELSSTSITTVIIVTYILTLDPFCYDIKAFKTLCDDILQIFLANKNIYSGEKWKTQCKSLDLM